MARKPIPDERRRSDRITTRVLPEAGEKFRRICRENDLTESDGVRQALRDWIKKMEKR